VFDRGHHPRRCKQTAAERRPSRNNAAGETDGDAPAIRTFWEGALEPRMLGEGLTGVTTLGGASRPRLNAGPHATTPPVKPTATLPRSGPLDEGGRGPQRMLGEGLSEVTAHCAEADSG